MRRENQTHPTNSYHPKGGAMGNSTCLQLHGALDNMRGNAWNWFHAAIWFRHLSTPANWICIVFSWLQLPVHYANALLFATVLDKMCTSIRNCSPTTNWFSNVFAGYLGLVLSVFLQLLLIPFASLSPSCIQRCSAYMPVKLTWDEHSLKPTYLQHVVAATCCGTPSTIYLMVD